MIRGVWAALLLAAATGMGGLSASEPLGPACPEVPGAGTLLDGPRVVLVGELHGTAESPEFVGALVCRALAAGNSVTVGLEWLDSEAERVAAYLASDGDTDARAALLAGPIWQARGSAQYGATSQAMLALLDTVRSLRGAGHPVEVALFNRYGGGNQGRDRRMAAALGGMIEASDSDLFVVLTGNIHSRLAAGTRFDPRFEPMGLLLQRAHPDWEIVALDVAHAGGTAWLCISGEPCGARSQRARGQAAEARFSVRVGEEVGANGHHGVYFVGPIHASPPAVDG